jgi:uracil-DNA glycosylase
MEKEDFKERFTECKPFREQVLDLLDTGSVIMAFGRFAQLSIFGMIKEIGPVPDFINYKGKTFAAYSNYHPAYILYKKSATSVFENILKASGVFKVEGGVVVLD